MQIPLIDLKAQLRTIEEEIKTSIINVVKSGNYILGPEVEMFEKQAAEYLGAKHAIGVASGTDALFLSLRGLDIGRGDEVITTSYSFFATAGAIANASATPVFVDIDERTYNINPQLIEQKITEKTRAIIPVHLFGQCSDMAPIMELSKKHKIAVIEDAAQAFGAKYQGKKAGTIGHLGCFSFFPSKNLGSFGDAGMVVTNDDDLANKIKTLRVHGAKQKYTHVLVGTNSRLDTLQAAALLVKLKHLDQWNDARRAKAQFYTAAFASNKQITTPYENNNSFHIYNQYTIRVNRRDDLASYLKDHKIGHAIYYPLPLHLQECFRYLQYKNEDLPEAERASKETISIPIYPEMSEEAQKYVIEKIGQFSFNDTTKQSALGFAV